MSTRTACEPRAGRHAQGLLRTSLITLPPALPGDIRRACHTVLGEATKGESIVLFDAD